MEFDYNREKFTSSYVYHILRNLKYLPVLSVEPSIRVYVYQSSDSWNVLSVSRTCLCSKHTFRKAFEGSTWKRYLIKFLHSVFLLVFFKWYFLTVYQWIFLCYCCSCIKGTSVMRSDLTLSWSVMQQIRVTRGCTLIWYVTHSTEFSLSHYVTHFLVLLGWFLGHFLSSTGLPTSCLLCICVCWNLCLAERRCTTGCGQLQQTCSFFNQSETTKTKCDFTYTGFPALWRWLHLYARLAAVVRGCTFFPRLVLHQVLIGS